MIPAQQFMRQIGGLCTAVIPYEQTDPIHRGALGSVLRDAVQHEAKVHGAPFNNAGFRNVMKAMAHGDVEVLFFAAAWDLCEPKIIGATINFPSVSLERKGDDIVAKRGIYSEDVCILPSKIRDLIVERPVGGKFPEAGIGTHFIQASMSHFARNGMLDGSIPAGQTFEFAPRNGQIVKIQEQLGARLGHDRDSSLLRLERLRSPIYNQWAVPVEVAAIPLPDGATDPNNFIVRWSGADGKQKIEAAFTKGISTFKGTTVTQAQFISNGRLPDTPIVESVLASILRAANHEIRMRRWGHLRNQPPARYSPSIPLLADRQETFKALVQAQCHELFSPAPAKDNSLLFGVKPPTMHLHVLNEPELAAGLQSLGAGPRMLGPNPMQTASLDLLKNTKQKYAARPIRLLGSEAGFKPIFSLAA